jgi:hypothetical protein
MCHSALRFPTHTDVQTEHGNPTLEELRQLLTALPREFTLAHVAFAPVRLQEPFDFKRMIKRLLKAVSFSFWCFCPLNSVCIKEKTQSLVINYINI